MLPARGVKGWAVAASPRSVKGKKLKLLRRLVESYFHKQLWVFCEDTAAPVDLVCKSRENYAHFAAFG